MKRLTTQEIADLLAVDLWRIQRLFESGILPEPERFGGRRAIPSTDIPLIIDSLRRKGWIANPHSTTEEVSDVE